MWMKVDDQLHAHRKTRAVLKSDNRGGRGKSRDAGPMGLWVLAGSWAAQNRTDGWVPADELDRFDDDARFLADRLVAAGYWWPQERDGEAGYGFNDWHDYNDPTDSASKAGTFGNHVRWHVNEAKVEPECQHCPTEPDEPEDRGDIAPDSGGDRGANRTGHRPDVAPESRTPSGAIALPVPDPVPDPDPNPKTTPLSDKSDDIEPTNRFDEFWETYSHKVGRAKAEKAYRAALKKPGVTEPLLIAAAAAYITWQMSEGKHPEFTKHPTTWLHGEHWRDERPGLPGLAAPVSNAQRWLALANETAEAEGVVKPCEDRRRALPPISSALKPRLGGAS